MEWWNNFSALEQTLFVVGAFTLAVFLVHTAIILLGGLDTELDFNADGDGTPVQELFTLRNLVSFLTGFSWISLGLMQMGLSEVFALLIGLVVGIVFAWLNMTAMFAVSKLQSAGNLNLQDIVGTSGRITLGMTAGAKHLAKVTVSIRDRQFELMARKNDNGPLDRNTVVRIVALEGETAVVEVL